MSREITKTLLLRNGNLDIILSGAQSRMPYADLPSWSPDWFSKPLLKSSVSAAENKTGRMSREQMLHCFEGRSGELKTSGIILGTVVKATSVLVAQPHTGGEIDSAMLAEQDLGMSSNAYYKSKADVICAVVGCLLGPRQLSSCCKHFGKGRFRKMHWDAYFLFAEYLRRWIVSKSRQDTSSDIAVFLGRWLRSNAEFKIRRKSLVSFLILPHFDLQSCVLFIVNLTGWCVSIVGVKRWAIEGIHYLLLGVPLVISTSFYIAYLLSCIRTSMREFDSELKKRLRRPRRLVLLDKGLIASTPGNVRLGDLVCFIEGCSSSVALRETRPRTSRFEVVGASNVGIRSQDRRHFLIFHDSEVCPYEKKLTKVKSTLYDSHEWRQLILV